MTSLIAKPKRKVISKKVRFEVFKRDGFKCQYCGKCAPDVILHVDHINPVSKGGDNEILNLVTACEECNGGKSDRLLTDDSVMAKQRAQLEELNKRREQLEMMLKWRDGLKDIGEQTLDAIRNEWGSVAHPFYLNETGDKMAKKLLRSFPLATILEAIQIASEQYIDTDSEGVATKDSIEFAWGKVGGIARNLSLPQEEKRLYYIRGICRNRFRYCNEIECIRILREAHKAGCDVEEMADISRCARNWNGWLGDMRSLMDAAGEE